MPYPAFFSRFLYFKTLSLPLMLAFFTGVSLAAEAPKAHLSLVCASTTVGKGPALLMGLRIQLMPGWKTYWRSPGGAGYSPSFTWEGSQNIRFPKVSWPLPHRVPTQMGVVNAYRDDLVLPVSAEVIDPAKPVRVSLNVDMLICDEAACLPVMQTLSLDLPAGAAVKSAQAPLLEEALKKVPPRQPLGHTKLGYARIKSVEVIGAEDAPPTIQVILHKKKGEFVPGDLPELFIELKDRFVDSPLVSLSDDHKSVIYSALVYPDNNKIPACLPDLIGQEVTLTFERQGSGIEVDQVLTAPRLSLAVWGGMLLVAFIGGLILNIMPCVLPVLSLKILSVLRQGGGHHATVRQEFLATVSGIIFSFLVLAMGTILLKMSGHAVGWGIQFQEPCFLIGLIGILTLFACNLLGFFEFRLPYFLSSLGRVSPHRESLLGSFLEGSLVTVLATPCTAPFVGTALAFALSRGSPEILSIFMAMGAGLATPFILIALFPSFAIKLPRPGMWMEKVQRALGVLILITALWLVYVLVAETGLPKALGVTCLMAAIFLLLKRGRFAPPAAKRLGWAGVTAAIVASFAIPSVFPSVRLPVYAHKGNLWQPFDPDRVEEYVKAGKTVFVTVTADWCLTCQANKYFVLNSQAVLSELQAKDVVAMEADWTNHDPKITSYLKSFKQYGIPFYAVYGCRNPLGSFLGQLLTPQKVIEGLRSEKCLKKETLAPLKSASLGTKGINVNGVYRISSCKGK